MSGNIALQLVSLLCAGAALAADQRAGDFELQTDSPKSLFVSPATLGNIPDAEVRFWFEHILAHHRSPGSPGRIESLVLTEIADADPGDASGSGARLFASPPHGMEPKGYHPANHKLDLISGYFSCFDSIYVGTVHIPWQGSGTAYDHGIRDERFRGKNIGVSTNAMERFIATYPQAQFNWYISYEANLNSFKDPKINEAYAAYNGEIATQMKVRRNADILWSPNFWSRFDAVTATDRLALARNLKEHFARVPITDLHFQDFMGGSSASGSGRFTVDDVRSYYAMLAGLGGPRVKVNAEMFVVTDARSFSLAPMSHEAYVRRMKEYSKYGLPLGASFEIRYWYAAHRGGGAHE